jgi:hypothetical protein
MPNVWGWVRTVSHGLLTAALESRVLVSQYRHTYEIGSTLAASDVKLACGNDAKWLLFDADYVLKLGAVEHVLKINIKEEAS